MTQLNDAYDLAVHNGYKGTRHDWLAALKRDKQNVWWRKMLRGSTYVSLSTFIMFSMSALWMAGSQRLWDMYIANGQEISYLMVCGLTVLLTLTLWSGHGLHRAYKDTYK